MSTQYQNQAKKRKGGKQKHMYPAATINYNEDAKSFQENPARGQDDQNQGSAMEEYNKLMSFLDSSGTSQELRINSKDQKLHLKTMRSYFFLQAIVSFKNKLLLIRLLIIFLLYCRDNYVK